MIANIKTIFLKLKEIFTSKDQNKILDCIGKLLIVLGIAILIKVPFIFISTIILDFINNLNLGMTFQNIMEILLELTYILIALAYIYNRLKKMYL